MDVAPPDAPDGGGAPDSGDAGIDGDGGAPDATVDAAVDVTPDATVDVTPDAAVDVTPDATTPDAAPDATDAPMVTDANPDAVDAPAVTDSGPEGPPPPVMLTVEALQHSIVLDRCNALLPATLVDVPAGNHTLTLTASTLSKGSVSNEEDDPVDSFDDYVIVHVPVAAGQSANRRLFMLNGVGSTASFTLSAVGTVRLMFIDSDATYNLGSATVTLDGNGPTVTVDPTVNVLPWNIGCSSTPATVYVDEDRPHRVTLVESTLSAAGGSEDDFVLVRMPSERPMYPFRWIILNGVGASFDFTPYLDDRVRAWFITPTAGASGRAVLHVTDL
jgi:hypothetical protein